MSKRRLPGPAGMSGMVSLSGASSLIKSIQRGQLFVGLGLSSATATLSPAVDVANARIRLLGYSLSAGDTNNTLAARLTLTSSTVVTLSTNTNTNTAYPYCSWEVVEYMPGVIKSIQRDTVAGNGTKAITTVNVQKTELDYLGCTGSDGNTNVTSLGRVALTSSILVTGNGAGGANDTLGFQVVEFF